MSGAILDLSDFERFTNCQKLHRIEKMLQCNNRYYCDDTCIKERKADVGKTEKV